MAGCFPENPKWCLREENRCKALWMVLRTGYCAILEPAFAFFYYFHNVPGPERMWCCWLLLGCVDQVSRWGGDFVCDPGPTGTDRLGRDLPKGTDRHRGTGGYTRSHVSIWMGYVVRSQYCLLYTAGGVCMLLGVWAANQATEISYGFSLDLQLVKLVPVNYCFYTKQIVQCTMKLCTSVTGC